MTEKAITQLLDAVADGRDEAAEALLAAVYEELRGLARAKVAKERPGFTLQASDLVHEAYLRLIGEGAPRFAHRRHFFGAAAEAMPRILIDHYRARNALKRGGDRERVPLETVEVPPESRDLDLEALSIALSRFAELDPRAHEVVQLRYFLGLKVEEAAQVLDVSPRSVKNDWRAARLWLKRALQKSADENRESPPDAQTGGVP